MVETITPAVSPALEHIIERPRLIAQLEEGGGARVTVLTAPAGFGKTTLARQWSERQATPMAWYRTTRASGDVALLAVQLDELLASIAPELPREPRRVSSIASVNPSPKPLGKAIARTFEPLTRDVLLVVDEWEAAGTEEAEELLSLLVDELDIRFLITTRERPDWFTPRLEVYGEGLEIERSELAMTDEEAADVLFYVRDKNAAMEVRTLAEGWPAVLGIAAIHGRAGSRADLSSLLPDALYDYLATELIDAAEPEVRAAASLIALTSAADLATARLLLGRAADDLLARARCRALVTIDRTGRIAIQPLLRRVLVARIANDPRREEQLHSALERILEHRLWNEAHAVINTLSAPDFVSRSVEQALPDLLRDGRLTTIGTWIEIGRAAGIAAGLLDYAEAELSLRRGETLRAYGLAVQAAQYLDGELASRAHLVAGRAAHLSDRPTRTEQHANSAAAEAQSSETLEGALWLRYLAALERQAPNLGELLSEFKAAAGAGVRQSLMAATGELSRAEIEGDLSEAISDALATLSVAGPGEEAIAETSLLSTLSYVLINAGRYEESLEKLERLTAVAEACSVDFALRYAQLYRAAAYVGMRRFALADRALSTLEREAFEQPGSYFRANVSFQLARLYASLADVQRALDVLSLGPVEGASRAGRGELFGWQAVLYAASGDPARARELAVKARATSRGLEARSLSLTAEATAALYEEEAAEADRLLEKAIDTRVWDPVLIGVRAAPHLGRHLAQSSDYRPWLQRLLASSADHSLAVALGLSIPRAAKPRGRLSPRETEVHELIAAGLSNDEISKLLYISLSTTKVHVKHIFEKLGVHSRVEAARLLQD